MDSTIQVDFATVDDTKSSSQRLPINAQPINSMCLWIHRKLLPIVVGQQSLRWVAAFQRYCGLNGDGNVSNWILYRYFSIASAAGEEIFSLVPILMWTAFPVAVPFLTNFMVLLIVGQLMKDCLMLPRPISPPNCAHEDRIVKLDSHFETEFGMPSTHTMSGFLPQVVLLALSRLCNVQFSTAIWAISTIYTASVGLSRLYLGVHSIYDVIGGALITMPLIAILYHFGDSLDELLYASPYSIYLITFTAIIFLFAYPRPRPWSAAYGTSAQIFGSWLGGALSFWFIITQDPDVHCTLLRASLTPICSGGCGSSLFGARSAATSTATCAGDSVPTLRMVYRVILSLIIAGIAKVVGKILPSALFGWLFRNGAIKPHPDELYDCFGQPVPLHKAYYFEVPVRLFNYCILGIVVIVLCPLCWQILLPDDGRYT